ncbi:MAG: dTDP-4-dehydrorhamnose 3,5-epimerase [Bacteroidales bacterium]|nr:dTDP-4-dehydrorhamnose 3,5-epimerase [Bacteroidales bacterium]
MNYLKTEIEGLYIIEPQVFKDNRGYFFESFSLKDFEKNIGKISFVQDNESLSVKRGVLRGLHFQRGEYAQAKLVRVVKGRVLDVAVDIRKESPTFGKCVVVELSEENKRLFFLPRGMAHAYLTLEDDSIFQYKCDNYYAPASEGCIIWNDPDIAINWPIDHSEIILSERDKSGITLQQYLKESK